MCSNCARLGKACLPYQPSARARPTNSEIARLEAQVHRLEHILLSVSEVGTTSPQINSAMREFAAYRTRNSPSVLVGPERIRDSSASPNSTLQGPEDGSGQQHSTPPLTPLLHESQASPVEGVTSRLLQDVHGCNVLPTVQATANVKGGDLSWPDSNSL